MLLHYLVTVEKPKKHVNTTAAFNVNYKIVLHASYYIDSFIKCSDESYKWTFMSKHAFKVSTTGMHTWPQMVTPAFIMFRVPVKVKKQVCLKRFHRSSMSWVFVSYMLGCITPQISKCKPHDDSGPLWWSYHTSAAIFFGGIPLQYYIFGVLTFIR